MKEGLRVFPLIILNIIDILNHGHNIIIIELLNSPLCEFPKIQDPPELLIIAELKAAIILFLLQLLFELDDGRFVVV